MPKRNKLRPFTDEEQVYLEKLSRSRTAAQQHVERATILLLYAANEPVGAIASSVKRRPETVWNVVKRFNQHGLASLQDIPRSGRPLTYGEEVRGQLVRTAKTHPQQLQSVDTGSFSGVFPPTVAVAHLAQSVGGDSGTGRVKVVSGKDVFHRES